MKVFTLSAALFLTACVTINIYFPAAAAEKVADQIIQEIQQETPESQNNSPIEPQSAVEQQDWQLLSWVILDKTLDFFISPAQAAANLDISSPDIQRIKASMKRRFPSLVSAYNQGWIGIKRDGFLTLKGNVPLKERNRINKLVAAENNDRQRLYQAIANANGHPEWADEIQQTFAKRWISHAHRGWWIQQPNGQWVRK
jgi:uncharacterized protein YdbL (DUF1318 family)